MVEGQLPSPELIPINWPSTIRFLTQPEHSLKLTDEQSQHLKSRLNQLDVAASNFVPVITIPLPPQTHIRIQQINDPEHPAYGQYGLFATQPLPPSSLIIPYFGFVHSNDQYDTDPESDYDLSLDREACLSTDANHMGNESRMINDYRGVPRSLHVLFAPSKKGGKPGPNAEFKDCWFTYDVDKEGKRSGPSEAGGERGIAIFVLGVGKSGRGAAGIRAGEEILVNYGKGFWKERAANGSDA